MTAWTRNLIVTEQSPNAMPKWIVRHSLTYSFLSALGPG